MKANIHAILTDCIERAINHALINHDGDIEHKDGLQQRLENEIWLNLDQYFFFDQVWTR